MTVQIDAAEAVAIAQVVALIASIVAAFIVALLVYLMVRPSRRRQAPPPQPDAIDVEELMRLVDRMEQRLEVLERAIGHEEERRPLPTRDGDQLLAGEHGPETRRMK